MGMSAAPMRRCFFSCKKRGAKKHDVEQSTVHNTAECPYVAIRNVQILQNGRKESL